MFKRCAALALVPWLLALVLLTGCQPVEMVDEAATPPTASSKVSYSLTISDRKPKGDAADDGEDDGDDAEDAEATVADGAEDADEDIGTDGEHAEDSGDAEGGDDADNDDEDAPDEQPAPTRDELIASLQAAFNEAFAALDSIRKADRADLASVFQPHLPVEDGYLDDLSVAFDALEAATKNMRKTAESGNASEDRELWRLCRDVELLLDRLQPIGENMRIVVRGVDTYYSIAQHYLSLDDRQRASLPDLAIAASKARTETAWLAYEAEEMQGKIDAMIAAIAGIGQAQHPLDRLTREGDACRMFPQIIGSMGRFASLVQRMLPLWNAEGEKYRDALDGLSLRIEVIAARSPGEAWDAKAASQQDIAREDGSYTKTLNIMNVLVVWDWDGRTVYPLCYGVNEDPVRYLAISSRNATVAIGMSIPGFAQEATHTVHMTPGLLVGSLCAPLEPDAVDRCLRTHTARGRVSVRVDADDPSLEEVELTILSKEDFSFYDKYGIDHGELIACWSTPEAPAVREWIGDAFAYLDDDAPDQAIMGALNTNPEQIYAEVRALQRALEGYGVAYSNSNTTSGLGGGTQRVRLAEQLIQYRGGVCFETCVAMASALEALGYHVIIAYPPGHVVLAVETPTNAGMYVLIETTVLSGDMEGLLQPMNMEEWIQRIYGERDPGEALDPTKRNIAMAVDLRRAREAQHAFAAQRREAAR